MRAEPRYTFSINLPISLYQKLLNEAGKGRVSNFIKEMLEEKLIKEKQNQEEQLKQQLIADYQSIAKSQKRQVEDEIWDETLNDAWKKDE